MPHRLGVMCLILVAAMAPASAGIEVHATCATELAREPAHVRTLRDEVARALASTPVSKRYTLDVSLVRLTGTTVGRQIEVRAEVRALISDERGRARWQSTSRATARGAIRDRALLQRDAIGAAARDIAKSVRSSASPGR